MKRFLFAAFVLLTATPAIAENCYVDIRLTESRVVLGYRFVNEPSHRIGMQTVPGLSSFQPVYGIALYLTRVSKVDGELNYQHFGPYRAEGKTELANRISDFKIAKSSEFCR